MIDPFLITDIYVSQQMKHRRDDWWFSFIQSFKEAVHQAKKDSAMIPGQQTLHVHHLAHFIQLKVQKKKKKKTHFWVKGELINICWVFTSKCQNMSEQCHGRLV